MYRLLRILLIALFVGLAIMAIKNNQRPKNLGVQEGRLAEVPDTPNGVSTQTLETDKQVEALPFKESQSETILALKTAITAYGGAKIIEEKEDYLYIVFTTGKMRFKDDAEFYLDTEDKLIHFRSASRIGYSDMGLNRERYETLSKYYLNE